MRPHIARTLLPLTTAVGLAGCARAVGPLVQPGCSAVALTAGPNTSMVYLARLDGALIAVDLGWWDAPRKVRQALGELDATPAEVTHVFLTHSHRDHVGAWRLLRRSEFH